MPDEEEAQPKSCEQRGREVFDKCLGEHVCG
jgi:hypothetical protein